MPRSGARSKKSRGKARKASPSPEEPTPALAGNSFAALAHTDQGGPAEDDEEQPDAADEAGALSTTPGSAGAAVEEGSSLAEDILAAPSALPSHDPVRVETAAFLKKCMLDGTTPPAWVLEMVLPDSRKPVSGPSDEKVDEVREVPQPQQNLDVVFERVQHSTTLATPIQQQSSSSDSSRTSHPDQSQPDPPTARNTSAVEALPTNPLTARNTSAVEALPTNPLTARTTSAVEAPRTARITSAVAPPSPTHNHNEDPKFSIKKSDMPASLKLHGLPTEDVPEIMALFHAHIRLHVPDGASDSVIDRHAVRYLAYLVADHAASTMNQIQCGTLEWRTDKELAQLNTEAVDVRAPRNWKEWVNAFTNLFSPVNRIVLLARTVSTLKQGSSESVDSYGLRVTQAYARLLAEAKQTAPANVSRYKHA